MCLLMFKKPGGKLVEAWLRQAWSCNPHGGGYVFHNGKELLYNKGLMTLEGMLHGIQTDIKPEFSAIIHFRAASVGAISSENTHPFDAGGTWWMGHNGTINDTDPVGDESDSAAFARAELFQHLEKKPEKILDVEVQQAIKDRICGSRLVFMNGEGKHVIINEGSGHWKDDVWYSNGCYMPPIKETVYDNRRHQDRWQKWEDERSEKRQKKVKTTFEIDKTEDGCTASGEILYEELVEVDLRKGCNLCGKHFTNEVIQVNPINGEFYCEACVFGLEEEAADQQEIAEEEAALTVTETATPPEDRVADVIDDETKDWLLGEDEEVVDEGEFEKAIKGLKKLKEDKSQQAVENLWEDEAVPTNWP